MPLYVVRWPNLTAAIVRASDEEDLLDKLDEQGNAESCRIQRYNGPLFIDFTLPAELETTQPEGHQGLPSSEHIRIKSVQRVLDADSCGLAVSAGDCETGHAMCEAVTQFAFPNTYRVISKGENHQPLETLAAAVRQDAMELVRAAWRWEHTKRATDPASRLAVACDLPTKLAKKYMRGMGDGEPTAPRKPARKAPPKKGGRSRPKP